MTLSVASLKLPWLGFTPRITMVCSIYWRRDYNIQFKGKGNIKRGKKKDSSLFLTVAHFIDLKYDMHTCGYK